MAIDKNAVIKEAQKFVAKGQYDKAIAEWRKIQAESPNDPNIYNTIGDLCLKNDSKSGAVDAYMHAAGLLASDGFTSKAIALYKKVLNIDNAKIEAHLALGEMNAEKGLTGNALENYKHVADHYILHQQTTKALEIYQKMADLNPSNVAFQVKLGDMYAKEGLKEKAAKSYLAAADAHVDKGAFKDARQLFEKVLALEPDNKAVYHKAGVVYFKEGKFVEACKAFKPAFEADPSNTELAELYIEAMDKAGKDADAEQVLRKLLAANPDNAAYRLKLYELYCSKKDFEKAVVEAATLAESEVKNGNSGAAEEIFKTFVAGCPDYPPGRQKLAEFYISAKRSQDAVAELFQAADLYAGEGDLLNAKSVLNQAIALAPDMPEAKERLERLLEPVAEAPVPEPEFTQEVVEPLLAPPAPVAPEPAPMPVLEAPAPAVTAAPPVTAVVPSAAAAGIPADEEPAVAEAIAETDVLIKYGLTTKAIEQLEALSSNFPESPRIRIKLRDLYREQGNIDKAVRHALLAVALYTKYGREDEATSVLRSSREMAPDRPAIIARIGRVPAAPEQTPVAAQEIASKAPEIPPAAPPITPEPEDEPGMPPEQVLTGEIPFEGLESPIPSPEELSPEEAFPAFEPPQPEQLPIEPEPPRVAPPAQPLPAQPSAAERPAEAREQAAVAQPAAVDVGEIWAEAEFYFQQGLFDEAKKHYTQIIKLIPGEKRAVDRLSEISREEDETLEFSKLADAVEGLEGAVPAQADEDELSTSESDDEAVRALMQEIQQLKQPPAAPPPPPEQKKAAPPPPKPAPEKKRTTAHPPQQPAAPAAAAVPESRPAVPRKEEKAEEDYDFFDLGEELMREESMPAAPAKAQFSAATLEKVQPSSADIQNEDQSASEDFFDLAAELRDDLSSIPVHARAAVPAEEQSLDDIFEEFKKGVEQQSVKEDADTHYNLGVAYKEMGLLDDAISEFIMTPEDEPKFVQSRYMLGLCYMEKGEYQNAIGEIQNALDYADTFDVDPDSLNRIEMLYDLGLANQGAGNMNTAISEFQKVADADPGYRDVAAKLKELNKGDFISLDQLKDDIEREISSKFLEEGVRIDSEEKTRKNERVKT